LRVAIYIGSQKYSQWFSSSVHNVFSIVLEILSRYRVMSEEFLEDNGSPAPVKKKSVLTEKQREASSANLAKGRQTRLDNKNKAKQTKPTKSAKREAPAPYDDETTESDSSSDDEDFVLKKKRVLTEKQREAGRANLAKGRQTRLDNKNKGIKAPKKAKAEPLYDDSTDSDSSSDEDFVLSKKKKVNQLLQLKNQIRCSQKWRKSKKQWHK